MLPGRVHHQRRAAGAWPPRERDDGVDPARPARCSARRRSGRCSRCCAPASSRSARACRRSSRRSPRASARRTRAPSPPARRRCTSRCARSACGEGDEVVTSPFSFVASANAILYERARPVFADIDPVTLNLDPAAAAAAISARTAALLPVHIFGYPADMPALERPRAADRRGRLRGARRGPRRRHAGRRPRPPGGVRLLRQQAADDRRGRDAHARLGRAQGAGRLRAQPGPRARHGLARPRPARLQLPADRHRVRARARAARAPRRDARRPRAGRRAGTARRWARSIERGLGPPVRGQRRRRARLVRVRRPAAARASTATPRWSRCASAACSPSPTCRRST